MSTGSESTNSYTISNLTNEFVIYPSYGDYVNAAVLVFFSQLSYFVHIPILTFIVTLGILFISYLSINVLVTRTIILFLENLWSLVVNFSIR